MKVESFYTEDFSEAMDKASDPASAPFFVDNFESIKELLEKVDRDDIVSKLSEVLKQELVSAEEFARLKSMAFFSIKVEKAVRVRFAGYDPETGKYSMKSVYDLASKEKKRISGESSKEEFVI